MQPSNHRQATKVKITTRIGIRKRIYSTIFCWSFTIIMEIRELIINLLHYYFGTSVINFILLPKIDDIGLHAVPFF